MNELRRGLGAQQVGKPLQKRQVLILTGYRSSGPVSTMFAALGRAGYVHAEDNLLEITQYGLNALGDDWTPLPQGKALRDHLIKTSSQMESKILQVLFDVFPETVAKGRILELTGYKSSGPVSSTFSKLVILGYAMKHGGSLLSAAPELFEEPR